MTTPKGDGMRHAILQAITAADCALPLQLRWFVACLAQLANWQTGRGLAGQTRIAAAMGCSPRAVRRYRVELEAAGGPVRVTWRGRNDGSGRTSDAYQLQLEQSGQIEPQQARKADSLAGKPANLAANPIQGSASAESPVDIFEKKIPPGPGTPAVADPGRGMGRGIAGRSALPVDWQPREREAGMAAEWGRDLAEAAATFRAHAAASGRRARDWDAAFELWLLRGRKPRHEAARRQEWREARAARQAAAARQEFAAAIQAAGGLGAKPVAGMRSRLAADRRLLGRAVRLLGAARGVALSVEQLTRLIAIAAGQP